MKDKALQAFRAYTDSYDVSNVNIKLKIDHTYRVASIVRRIARSLELEPMMIDFAWLLGLLHDIGRFEQYSRFGTFKDAESVDHAELGADIVRNDRYYVNLQVQNARIFPVNADPMNPGAFSEANMENEFVGVVIDVNDRYQFNNNEKYRADKDILKKLVDEIGSVLDNDVKGFLGVD